MEDKIVIAPMSGGRIDDSWRIMYKGRFDEFSRPDNVPRSVSLKPVVNYVKKYISDEMEIFVKIWVDPELGYKFIPIAVYLSYCDEENMLEYLKRYIKHGTTKNNFVSEDKENNDFEFLMLNED